MIKGMQGKNNHTKFNSDTHRLALVYSAKKKQHNYSRYSGKINNYDLTKYLKKMIQKDK